MKERKGYIMVEAADATRIISMRRLKRRFGKESDIII
jgi:hypothetical protein